jgi:uncharacterized protein YukE
MVGISGGAGLFGVVPEELTAAANQAEHAADALGRIPRQVSGALGDAAARGGLELGRAISDTIASWEQGIADRAAAVHDAAERLRSTATSYASTEDDTALSIRRAHRALYD